ncbi:MAG: SH3 domain-containing protein [Parachlamydiaceae bacterium]|nr:SH3 domain-containing protein [Parachlamydiaceae bacterium]
MRHISPLLASFSLIASSLLMAEETQPLETVLPVPNEEEKTSFPKEENNTEKAAPIRSRAAKLKNGKQNFEPIIPVEKDTAEKETPPKPVVVSKPKVVKQNFEPFTGKVTKNKVRMRLQPNFDGASLREMNRDQLIVIVGEEDDFYAVQPPSDMKAFIFRTYVLDNVIEGTRVNVRLQPDLEAPVIAQLNSGDRVNGHIYPANNKWLEIPIPNSTRFFIAKEYIEKVGDADYVARLDKRREDVYRLLNTTKAVSDAEMQKQFPLINLDGIVANYKKIILDYKDFPEAGVKAQAYLNEVQDAYTKKKIAFLEQQSQQSAQALEQKNKKLSEELDAHKNKLNHLEKQVQNGQSVPQDNVSNRKPTQLPYNMATWIPAENSLCTTWSQENNNNDPAAFYQDQKQKAFVLKGIVDSYNRPVKNKPGDFMLLNASSRLPIAFLYSTQVNLQDYLGHEVSIMVVPRPNYNYAFPAYFVISVE